MILGSVHTAFIRFSPSVNRALRLSGSTPNAESIRVRPPAPNPTSTRPRLSWSSELMALARWTGLCRELTNTAQPIRSRSVHAAAYDMTSSGASCGVARTDCSSVHALSNPSASARVKYARNRAGSNAPSSTNCGMHMANRTLRR